MCKCEKDISYSLKILRDGEDYILTDILISAKYGKPLLRCEVASGDKISRLCTEVNNCPLCGRKLK